MKLRNRKAAQIVLLNFSILVSACDTAEMKIEQNDIRLLKSYSLEEILILKNIRTNPFLCSQM